MKYHLPCLVNAKRDIDQSKQPQSATVNCGQLLSDCQLLEIVETELNDSSKDVVMNMNDIHQMYMMNCSTRMSSQYQTILGTSRI